MKFQSTPRERMILAIGVGSVAVVVLAVMGWMYVSSMFSTQQQTIDDLTKKLQTTQLKERKAMKSLRELHGFRARSLPAVPDVARSVYQQWILEQLSDVKLEDQVVTAGALRELPRKLGFEMAFGIRGKGTLPQIVQLLDSLQRPDILHRIERLTLKPLPDSKLFDVTVSLDALALAKADAASSMPKIETSRLKLASADEYEAIICGRNIFGPENHPPSLKGSSSQTAYVGKEFSYSLDAKDPDKLDHVTYRLESSDPGVSLDPKSGKLRWQPKEKGKFEFTVFAKDDGLPAKEATAKIVVNVTDAPKPPPVTEVKPMPPKLGFDDAKYTILAGITEVNDEREIWLLNRPKGELLKLRVGDKFKIGATEGTIESIGEEDFIFTMKELPHRLYRGETLNEAVEWEGN